MKLSGTLPEGEANGLASLTQDMVNDPAGLHVVVAVVNTKTVTRNTDDGTKVPTVRIRRIEPLLASDLGTARRLLERAFEHRTGKATLPFELEDELEAAFEGVQADDEDDGGPS